MFNKLLKGYCKLSTMKNHAKELLKSGMRNNKGEVTVQMILWVIITVVIILVIVYGFISGWFTDLLNNMKDVTDDKMDPVIN